MQNSAALKSNFVKNSEVTYIGINVFVGHYYATTSLGVVPFSSVRAMLLCVDLTQKISTQFVFVVCIDGLVQDCNNPNAIDVALHDKHHHAAYIKCVALYIVTK